MFILGIDINISFLLLFGGIAGILILILFKNLRIIKNANHNNSKTSFDTLYSWHTPNLRKWKKTSNTILYWLRDISIKYWVISLISFVKLIVYHFLKFIHRKMLAIIRYLEQHEEKIKTRLSEQSIERSAHEQRLIRTLSSKKHPTRPVNSPDR